MKKTDLIRTLDPGRTHNLTVKIEADRLVFNQGDYFRPVDDGTYRDDGREYDEYLTVEPVDRAMILQRLFEDLPAALRPPKNRIWICRFCMPLKRSPGSSNGDPWRQLKHG